ncbi:MAG: hypothetical protein HYX46_10290 [Betaproteobacteria bacterium]|nr:hypothetical protein [Betaproteobacteria bacterium]
MLGPILLGKMIDVALTHILGLTLIPVAATVLGGGTTVFRVPSDKTRSLVQHFAAGVIMADARATLWFPVERTTLRVSIRHWVLQVNATPCPGATSRLQA